MGVFSTPANRKVLLVLGLLGAIGTGIGFALGWPAGVLALALSLAMLAVVVIHSRRRYGEIDELVRYLDRVLQGDYTLNVAVNEEGELKILQSELYKMTVTLREQADALRADKVYLADSIADISHQLRTPLTSMHLTLSMLSREDCAAEQRQALLRELTLLLSRMDSLIAALLKISKIDAGTAEFQKESVSVYRVLQKAMEPLAIPMELRGQSVWIKGDRKASFLGDEMWSVEAICNILKNCMEHMEENGKIMISTEENALYTELVIRDTGKGIDKADLPHIFERFYRGKNADSNSFGIGLALSRMIITQQNGTIKAGNHPEGGSKFTIRFYKSTI